MDINTGKDKVQWLHAVGGLYFGRDPSGHIRVCMTNGLPPWDDKAQPAYCQLQPEQLVQITERLTDRPITWRVCSGEVVLSVAGVELPLVMLAKAVGGEAGERIAEQLRKIAADSVRA